MTKSATNNDGSAQAARTVQRKLPMKQVVLNFSSSGNPSLAKDIGLGTPCLRWTPCRPGDWTPCRPGDPLIMSWVKVVGRCGLCIWRLKKNTLSSASGRNPMLSAVDPVKNHCNKWQRHHG